MFKKTPNLGAAASVAEQAERIIPSSPTPSSRKYLGNFMCRSTSQCIALFLLVCISPIFLYRMWLSKRLTGQFFKQQVCVGYQRKPFNYLVFNSEGWGKYLPLLLNILRGEMRFTGVRALSPEEATKLTRTRDLIHFSAYPGIFTVYALQQRLGIDYKTELEVEREYLSTETFSSNLSLILRSLFSLIFNQPASKIAKPHLEIFGVTLSNTTLVDALDEIMRRAQTHQKSLFSFVNADCLNIAYRHWKYRQALAQADQVFADGSGIRVACRLLKEKLLGNVNGTDLFPKLCERLADTNLSIYLLGAKPGIAQTTATVMQQRYAGLKIAGTRDGYFKPEETAQLIEQINQSGAAILLVAMGAPRQELWLAEHRAQLTPAVCMGVGGLFDFYSGRIPRAPVWMREIGLEWVWRLLQEPTRMWKRYLIGNPLFLYRILQQARQQRSAETIMTNYNTSYLRSFQHLLLDFNLRWDIQKMHVALILKRLFDIVLSIIGLMIVCVALCFLPFLIKLDSKGPVFYPQHRVGKNGKVFTMWKFRSMEKDADEKKALLAQHNEMNGGVTFKIKQDPRITSLGKFIRKFSIDEIPQLWNVLWGDMSLVGPRPPLPSEVAAYTPHQWQRLKVTPGITCIWQVSGRSEIPFPQQVELDLEYIARQSFWFDLELIVKTIPAVLKARGAY
ncbi:MAG: WecB/TagA/CpsF family glycosyltransferase [Thiotrichaceae bacterium]|nr:WecB/TagA/CpsF family glycosyltransferase [Thiotrichaceae bacterium]